MRTLDQVNIHHYIILHHTYAHLIVSPDYNLYTVYQCMYLPRGLVGLLVLHSLATQSLIELLQSCFRLYFKSHIFHKPHLILMSSYYDVILYYVIIYQQIRTIDRGVEIPHEGAFCGEYITCYYKP